MHPWNHPALAFPGDVIIANGEGPPQVAGNSVKPPVALETPQSKVQRTTSQLSMLAAPTVVVSDSATPPTPLLNDAQSQQFSPPVPTPPRLGDAKVASTPSGNLGPTVREKPKKPAPCYNSKYDKYYHQTLVQISICFFLLHPSHQSICAQLYVT